MSVGIFDNISSDAQYITLSIKTYLPYTSSILGLLLAVHLLNRQLGYHLNLLGIYPRSIRGLIGICFSPFLHGDFNHMFFNAFPLMALMHMVLLSGMDVFQRVSLTIILLGGLLTWLVGRKNLHVGSSTVIMGYFGFLATQSYLAPSFITVLVICVCLYYFFGLVLSLFPTDSKVSWEGHVCGFLSGVFACIYLPEIMGL